MSKVWLITGSGNGLGRDIAEAALAAGNSVVAGARRTEELAPLVAQYGERVKPVRLEVRDEAAAKADVQLAVDSFGRLDVLVNNAGYGQVCAVRADECAGLPGDRGHMLLRRGVHHARRGASDA
jgi:NADP-dependent 3-hydroxy acid dehydrogenase YdfG